MTRWAMAVLLAACGYGDNVDEALFFDYSPDRYVLCGHSLDDYVNPINWERVAMLMDRARDEKWIYQTYAHGPDVTVSRATLERVIAMAAERDLPFVTYAELVPGAPRRGGIALTFDDDGVDEWLTTRELFADSGVRATYFITNYPQFTEAKRAGLRVLADAGHDIQAHSIDHVAATEYVAALGMQAWLDEQALPSLELLRDDGYPADSFAYPYGDRSDETDAALQPHVRFVRSTPGPCPY